LGYSRIIDAGPALGDFKAGDEFLVCLTIKFLVNPEQYTLTLETGKQASDKPNMDVYFDLIEGVGPITVYNPEPEKVQPFYGMAQLPCQIDVI
jgi:hypothetical protein